MAQPDYIYIGPPNGGTGDSLYTSFTKSNEWFSFLDSRAQTSPPPTLTGSVGDQAGMYAYDSTYFYYCFANYDGSSVIWAQLQQAGNISATQILNGTSSIAIAGPNANATVNIYGTPNVAIFSNLGVVVSGIVSASGNIRGGNINTTGAVSAGGNIVGSYILGNGSQLTGLPTTYNNTNVAAFLSGFGSNTISTTGTITSGNITGANLITTGSVSSQGNITTQSVVSATGDIITAGLFIGNFAGNISGNLVVPGSNTQVLFNLNGNAGAVGGMTYNKDSNTFIVLGTISSQGNTIGGNLSTGGTASAAGNITGGNLLTGGYSSAAGNVRGGNILTVGLVSASGNITGSNLVTNGLASATGNITGGNLVTNGLASATGNITGGNIVTGGIVSAAGNIYTNSTLQVAVNLNVGGNITTTNLTGTGISVTSSVIGGNLRTVGQVSATGNITGNYFFGNGALLTGGYGNPDVTSLLAAFGSNPISTTGNITGGNINAGSLVYTTGNVNAIGAVNTPNVVITKSFVFNGLSGNASLDNSANFITTGNILSNGSISASGAITVASVVGGVMTGSSLSVTGNVTGGLVGTVYTNSIVNTGSNATGNIGSSANYFNTVFATSTTALYADLAECYLADAEYAPGTVLVFGGSAEVTIGNVDADPLIAGVVSTNPAYKMNSGLTGQHVVVVALTGRVPCQVEGPISRGAMMVSAGNGRARAEANPAMGTVIGKAVESFTGDIGTIEIVVGRL
jgi:hypothetical protein